MNKLKLITDLSDTLSKIKVSDINIDLIKKEIRSLSFIEILTDVSSSKKLFCLLKEYNTIVGMCEISYLVFPLKSPPESRIVIKYFDIKYVNTDIVNITLEKK